LEGRLAPATLTVNTSADTAAFADPFLSLRGAINIVNAPFVPNMLSLQILAQISGRLHEGGTDTIIFDPTRVTTPIRLSGGQLELSLPSSTASITIDGGTAGVAIDAHNSSRIFKVDAGVQATLNNLTLTRGSVAGFDITGAGGGILNLAGTLTVAHCQISSNTASYGGGIFNQSVLSPAPRQDAVLTVTDSTLSANSAVNPGNGAGGGIWNQFGTLTVNRSTLSFNSSQSGGGIENSGSLTLTNSTLSNNSASGNGGAIDNFNTPITLTDSTVSSNSASQGGGIFSVAAALSPPALLHLQSTIVAGNRASGGANSGPDIQGQPSSDSSYNLIGVGDSTLSGISNGTNHNQIGTPGMPLDPRLDPLGNFGGPTQTAALMPGSPALGQGDPNTTLLTDQRGLPRKHNGQVDVGAFQTQSAFPQTAGVFDPNTATWYLRNSNSGGAPDAGAFSFGAPGWIPVVGDWSGHGNFTVGVVDPATATWYLRNSNTPGAPDAGKFQFGLPGWIPVVGDWTHSGHSGIGMFDPTTATWYLRTEVGAGSPDAGTFQYGAPGWVPVTGDWDGNGTTTVGVFDPAGATWYLRNSNSAGAADAGTFSYGVGSWTPVVGDWNGTGTTKVGIVDPSTGTWYLRGSNTAGAPDVGTFVYGAAGWNPVAGLWTPAVRSPMASQRSSGGETGSEDWPASLSADLARLEGAGVTAEDRSDRADWPHRLDPSSR
jgi:hypothetical protein